MQKHDFLKKVHLPNHGTFFFHTTADSGPLIPLDHVDPLTGDIKESVILGWIKDWPDPDSPNASYAHVHTDGTIRRFRTTIGTRNDLELVQ